MTGIEYAKHARALAKAFHVRLVEDSGMALEKSHVYTLSRLPDRVKATMGPDAGKWVGIVFTSPVEDATTYAVALHEIGHAVDPLGNLNPEYREAKSQAEFRRLKILAEESAWKWAQHYAAEWTPDMDAAMAFGLASYESMPKEEDPMLATLIAAIFGGDVPTEVAAPISPADRQQHAAQAKQTATTIVSSIKARMKP
jgi:hypothetical protein